MLLDVIFFADDVLGVENALGLGGVVKAIVLLAEGNEVDNVGVAAIGAGGGVGAFGKVCTELGFWGKFFSALGSFPLEDLS